MYSSLFLALSPHCSLQAERSTVALQLYHPALKDVWGDLERSIAIVEPKKLDPPASLKVTLLPFQQESLYWMKEQEKGPWKGGMLAVSVCLLPNIALSDRTPCKDEMGLVLNMHDAYTSSPAFTEWARQYK